MSTAPEVVDDADRHRLEIRIDDQIAHLDYTLHDGRLRLVHTVVPDELGGRGLGGVLVQAALDKAVAGDLEVVVVCPFARSWLEKHPDAATTAKVVA